MGLIDDGLTLEEKQLLLKELTEAISTGAKRIRFRERDVTYQSTSELLMAKKALEDGICSDLGAKRRNVVSTTFDRGF